MNLILYLSEAVIPILVLLIVGNGLMHRQHVYEDFLEGAKSGNPHSSGDYADANRTDGSSRYFAGFGFFGFYFRVAWKINGGDRISDRADPGCCGKNVFFLCSNGTFYWISTKHMVQIRCWDVRHRLCSAAQRPFFIPCRFILCR